MKPTATQRLSAAIAELLKRMHNYSQMHLEKKQPFGLCVANPKHAGVPSPSDEIKQELEKRAGEYFKAANVHGVYFRYWTPPILPAVSQDIPLSPITADDYLLTFTQPQFDVNWEITTMARSLIYCCADGEEGSWADWYEPQIEAIRLAPLLHQTLKELEIRGNIERQFNQSYLPLFEDFIYSYALTDSHFPLPKGAEAEKWKNRSICWKNRYSLVANILPLPSTLYDAYKIAHTKAASTRNPILKSLLWAFVNHIEDELIINTELPTDEKNI